MKIKASVTPWSSVVGTSVALVDDASGRSVGMLSLIGVGSHSDDLPSLKKRAMALASIVADRLDGVEIPDAQ